MSIYLRERMRIAKTQISPRVPRSDQGLRCQLAKSLDTAVFIEYGEDPNQIVQLR